jgi:hypothetical protein
MTVDPDQSSDALPVLAQRPPARAALVPARGTQAAVVAAGGLVAAGATVAIVRRRRARKPRSRRARTTAALGSVVASRSFLIDVHLLRSGD